MALKSNYSNSVTESNSKILNAIIVLARTYAIAKNVPSKYAKYEYDFPGMIKVKLMSLDQLNRNTFWIGNFSKALLKSLDSPKEIINICNQYLREMQHDSPSNVIRKEHTNVNK